VRAQTPQFDFAAPPAADRALGVFETMLVRDGRVAHLERHLERLLASARALYRAELPADTGARAVGAAAGHELARLRIAVVPQPREPPTVGFDLAELSAADIGWGEEATLVTVAVTAGNGRHKLIDRSWLREIETHVGAGAGADAVRALLVAPSGELLETTRANVLLLRGGALATPPLDGSILPGVVRGAALAHAERLGIDAHELPLTLEHLRDADMALLSGSLRLLERVNLRGGNRRSARVAAHLSEALAADTVTV
jgi:para-aminobenzoate synthetase/4-amino-4-deoxychorismate lyase